MVSLSSREDGALSCQEWYGAILWTKHLLEEYEWIVCLYQENIASSKVCDDLQKND